MFRCSHCGSHSRHRFGGCARCGHQEGITDESSCETGSCHAFSHDSGCADDNDLLGFAWDSDHLDEETRERIRRHIDARCSTCYSEVRANIRIRIRGCPSDAQLSDLANSLLPQPWKEVVENHCETCERCSKLADDLVECPRPNDRKPKEWKCST